MKQEKYNNPVPIIIISIAIYICSLFLPAGFQGNGHIAFGYYLLLIGWAGIIFGCFAWLANILYAISILLLLNNSFKRASYFLAASILVGLQSFNGIPIDYERTSPPGIAFYVWELSFIILFIYTLLQLLKKRN